MHSGKPSVLFIAIINPGFSRFETTKYGLQRSYDLLSHKYSILNLTAWLRENGCDGYYAWTVFEDFRSTQEFEKAVEMRNPDAFAFSLCTDEFMAHYRAIEQLKRKYPDIPVIVGGPHVSALPFHTLEHFPDIDYVAVGDGEHILLEWLLKIRSGASKQDMREVRGLGFRDDSGRVVLTAAREKIPDVGILPEPAFDLVLNPATPLDPNAVMPIMCSYGCRFFCTFCAADHGNYRYYTPKRVVDRIEKTHKVYGARYFSIIDGLWPPSPKWLNEFCDEMETRKLRVGLEFATRAESLKEADFRRLKEIGAQAVAIGVESGDPGVLKKIRKGITRESAARAFQSLNRVGIFSSANLMVGNMGETRETIRATIDFAAELNPSIALFRAHCPIPGTEAFKLVPEAERDFWITGEGKDWWMQGDVPSVCGIPFDELQKTAAEAYLRYPLRMRYFLQHVIGGHLTREQKRVNHRFFITHMRRYVLGTLERFRFTRFLIQAAKWLFRRRLASNPR